MVGSLTSRWDVNKIIFQNMEHHSESRVVDFCVKSMGGVEPQRIVHGIMLNREKGEETFNVSCEEDEEEEGDANPITEDNT